MTNPYSPPNNNDLTLDSYTKKITNILRWKLEGASFVYAIQIGYILITRDTISLESMFITFMVLISVLIVYDVFNMVKFWHKN